MVDRDLAGGADVDRAELTGVDVDEGVGAEMLGDPDLALPGALGGAVATGYARAGRRSSWRRAASPRRASMKFIVGLPMKPATKRFFGVR